MSRTLFSEDSKKTMISYPFPDVYRQEIFPQPDPSFLTGVPLFLGIAQKGPINEPMMLHLWQQFAAIFGDSDDGYLSYAVRGFFENGGQVAYVLRLNDDVTVTPLESLRKGLTAVSDLETCDLICAPDLIRNTNLNDLITLQKEIVNHCQLLGDRFAILDTGNNLNREKLIEQSKALNSSFGALYHPWLTVRDASGRPHAIPPCGHIAGIYARSDQLVGVHKAPANEVLDGVISLQKKLTKIDQTELFKNNINMLRSFTGRGIRVWGARTLSTDPVWQYVNVRRLFIAVGRWLTQFMTLLPFEPNDARLWVRISREVEAYLQTVYQQGALKGQTAKQAFYVRCDEETNGQDVRDAGQVVTQIGLAPAVPGEFIDLRVVRGNSGVTVTAAAG